MLLCYITIRQKKRVKTEHVHHNTKCVKLIIEQLTSSGVKNSTGYDVQC